MPLGERQMVTLLLEDHVHDGGNFNRMIYAGQELGMKVIILDREELLKELPKNSIFFGSLNLIRILQARSDCPKIWCDWEKFRCQSYYPRWGNHLLQEQYGFYPFAEVLRMKDFLYSIFGKNNKMFIRPDENDKSFTGAVVEKDYWIAWEKRSKTYEPEPDTLCVVSRPEFIHNEFRLIVANGKVITGSKYSEGGFLVEEGYPKESVELVESCKWHPHDLYVADVAFTGAEYKLLEIGPVNGAGLYKCEVLPILKAAIDNIS